MGFTFGAKMDARRFHQPNMFVHLMGETKHFSSTTVQNFEPIIFDRQK